MTTTTLTIGHETTLTQLEQAYAAGQTDTLRAYCQWNDANGDWRDEDGSLFPAPLYMEVIEGWFADDSELPR